MGKGDNDNSRGSWGASASGDGWGASARGDKSREGCCYSPLSRIRMADDSLKEIGDLEIGDEVKSLDPNGVLVNTEVKKIIRDKNFLYNIPYGHSKITEATIEHKFKTMHGAKRVNELCLDDFLCVLKPNGKVEWQSVDSITLSSPSLKPVVHIRTRGTSNILLEGEVVAYNYSHFRQFREWLNRQLG
jgi:hypothetical protein